LTHLFQLLFIFLHRFLNIKLKQINMSTISAKIDKVVPEYNISQNGQQGMNIRVSFSVLNMLNKKGQCNAYFYNSSGNPLMDKNKKYHTNSGKVCSWYTYTPAHANCVYNDFLIFMPYEELHVEGRHSLKFQVEILDDKLKSIARSALFDFWVEWKTPKDSPKTEHFSLNRNYNWYFDQKNTGSAESKNCGPTCAVMAAKWSNQNFNMSVVNARNSNPMNGQNWTMAAIQNFLDSHKIPCTRFSDQISEATIRRHLNNKSIIIVIVNMKDIPLNNNSEQRTGKYYNLNENHVIIIKGFCKMDNKFYFEVYDPNTWEMYYSDGAPKGRDRYYLTNQVVASILNGKTHYIVVS